jgi:hypothetical protein
MIYYMVISVKEEKPTDNNHVNNILMGEWS